MDIPFFQTYPFMVVVLPALVSPGKPLGAAAVAVLFFQEGCRICGPMPFFKIIIDPEFSSFNAASIRQPSVDLILGNKVLPADMNTFRRRERQLLYHQVIQFPAEFFFRHTKTDAELFFPCFELPQCRIHMAG